MERKICKCRVFWWATCEFINLHHPVGDDKLEMVGDGLFDGFMVRPLSAVDSRNSHASNRSLLVETLIRQSALMTHSVVVIAIEG